MKPIENTALVCKYFTGITDLRYGDIQTASPVQTESQDVPGKYVVRQCGGFLNFTFDDQYLIKSLAEFAAQAAVVPRYAEPVGDDILGDAYRAYVYSNYVHEIWQTASGADAEPPDSNIFPSQALRRLCVMALFLADKANGPQQQSSGREPFETLYDIFSKQLYRYLMSLTLGSAPDAAKLVTAAALILRACREV